MWVVYAPRGLNGKSSKIAVARTVLTDQNIDIALITETWLSPGDTLRLPGYEVHRKDRENPDNSTPREEVLIATHNSISIEHTP